MKLINQEEITEEDLEEAQGKEKNFLSKMFSSLSSVLAIDDSEEEEAEEPKEEISLEDLVGPDSSEYPAVFGLRQNTIAIVHSRMEKQEKVGEAAGIYLSLPDFQYFMTGTDYYLLEDALVLDSPEGKELDEYRVGITSVTWKDEDGSSGEVEPEEDDKGIFIPITTADIGKTYTITYQACNSENEPVGEPKELKVPVRFNGGVGDSLDRAGDVAYLTRVSCIEKSLSTGTAPWDEEQKDENGNVVHKPGEDTKPEDEYLRTYDTATFAVEIENKVRDTEAGVAHFENGTVCFELMLPCSPQEAMFNVGDMGWLETKPNIHYEETVIDNHPVVRGSFLWEQSAESGGQPPIGAGSMELTISLRALAMKNGEKLQPKATFWMGVNPAKDKDGNSGKLIFAGEGHAARYDFQNMGLVTGVEQSCEKPHHEEEVITAEAPEIIISAAPSYNIQLKMDSSDNSYRGSFDFSTGYQTANPAKGTTKAANFIPSTESGHIVEGRAAGIGAVLQVRGKNGRGLRGVELPDTSKPITFDLSLESVFEPEGGQTKPEIDKNYQPLLWSVEGNLYGASADQPQGDGRLIAPGNKGQIRHINAVPANAGGGENRCYQGGTWSAEQEGNILHVTVEGFDLSLDMKDIPYMNFGAGSAVYYNPEKNKNYWEVDALCFSAGEFWILQPFARTKEDGGKAEITKEYECSKGMFNLTIRDKNLMMQSQYGTKLEEADPAGNGVDNQTNWEDVEKEDKLILGYSTTLSSGKFYTGTSYLKSAEGYNDSLTEGCRHNGRDWAAVGSDLSLYGSVYYDDKEEEEYGVAYDLMIKFDDAMFEPYGTGYQGGKGGAGTVIDGVRLDCHGGWDSKKETVLYGIRRPKAGSGETREERGKKGWYNENDEPEDNKYDLDMINARVEDIEFMPWSEFEPLQKQGYVCVAALTEWRGVDEVAGELHCLMFVEGRVKDNPELPGHVYMISQFGKVWKKSDVREAVKEYYQTQGITIEGEPTKEQYNAYVKNQMPSQSGHQGYGSYPRSVYERYVSPSEYTKTRYNEEGSLIMDKADEEMNGDSCYIVSCKAKIKKGLSQKSTNNGGQEQDKTMYDVGAGQWVADYYLDPSIQRAGGVDSSTDDGSYNLGKVVITDTLPQGLTYMPGSSRIGGTYTQAAQEGRQGTVTGGEAKEPEISTRTMKKSSSIGKEETVTVTDLVWTFENVKLAGDETKHDLPRIYYSCRIDPDQELSAILKELKNEVKIGGEGLSKLYTKEAGNLEDISIKAYTQNSAMLYKTADQSIIDIQTDGSASLGFQSSLVNSGANGMDVLFLDAMPYKGDAYGSFYQDDTCKILLTEWSLPKEAEADWISNLSFYYTTNTSYRGKTSQELKAGKENFENTAVWTKVTPVWDAEKEAYVFAGLSDGAEAVAIAAVGTLPTNETISMHTTLKLTKASPGDNLAPTVSNNTLDSMARSYILTRAIEGLVWLDVNHNGIQDPGEPKLPGIKVTLKLKKTDSDLSGWTDKETTTDENGRYQFTTLPAGEFKVIFSSGAAENQDAQLSNYLITAKDAGGSGNDSRDSDAEGKANTGTGSLESAEITNIPPMKEVGDIQSAQYVQRNWDLGLCAPTGAFRFRKVDGDSGKNLAGAVFELEGNLKGQQTANQYTYWAKGKMKARLEDPSWQARAGIELSDASPITFDNEKATFTITFKTTDKKIDFSPEGMEMLLPYGSYTLKEIQAPDGYEISKEAQKGYSFTIGENNLTPTVKEGVVSNDPQQFAVKKLAEETNGPLSGVTFRLYEGSEANRDKMKWEKETGSDGFIHFSMSGMKVNQIYRLEEEEVSVYKPIDPIYFKLVPDSDSANSKVTLTLTDKNGKAAGQRADVSLEEKTGEGGQKNMSIIQVTNTRKTGSLTLTKKTDASITSITGLKDEFEFTLKLEKPDAQFANFVKSSELKQVNGEYQIKGQKKGQGQTGEPEDVWYPIRAGVISGIKLKIGEEVRFNGIYYGTGFTITEDQSVRTGFIFEKVTTSPRVEASLKEDEKVTYGNSSEIKGGLAESDENLTVNVYNQPQKAKVKLSKTFDSDVPEKENLPKFDIYDVTDIPTAQRIPVQADASQGTVSKEWKKAYPSYQNPVDTIQISKVENTERYEGESSPCLVPGRSYQIVEELGGDTVSGYYHAAVSKVFSVTVGETNQVSCELITLGNHRAFGFLNVKKRVIDSDGREINAITRPFYYKILKADGSDYDGVIHEITTNQEDQQVVPLNATYQIIEVDSQGNPYETSGENPGYEVTNSGNVTVELDNAAGNKFTGLITNKEKPLGMLTVKKLADYAEKGAKFYFKVTDSRGQVLVRRAVNNQVDFIPLNQFEEEFKPAYLW